MFFYCYYDSPVGLLELSATEKAVRSVVLADKHPQHAGPGGAEPQGTGLAELRPAGTASQSTVDPHSCGPLLLACDWLDAYFDGKRPDPSDVPVDAEGTAFQKEVWDIVRTIPYGSVITYGDIADELSLRRMHKMAAQAVGGAMKKNPVIIIVPCHRVIAAGGRIGGYGGAPGRPDVKRYLLAHEGVQLKG